MVLATLVVMAEVVTAVAAVVAAALADTLVLEV
jgi:hypothetical protein